MSLRQDTGPHGAGFDVSQALSVGAGGSEWQSGNAASRHSSRMGCWGLSWGPSESCHLFSQLRILWQVVCGSCNPTAPFPPSYPPLYLLIPLNFSAVAALGLGVVLGLALGEPFESLGRKGDNGHNHGSCPESAVPRNLTHAP